MMNELIETYWPYLLVGLAILIAIGAYLLLASRKTSVISDRRDVLDEGAERAKRNTALIEARRHSDELSRAANSQQVAHATALADAEAGAQIAPAGTADPVPTPAAAPVASTTDDLTRIKGLGPKIANILGEMGVLRFADIAAWTDSDIDRIDAQLGRFQGRIRRDAWVEQAKLLSSGDESGFNAKFGQNG
jgi:predicted flap endonuclease-1-like 5' DNA nuclease